MWYPLLSCGMLVSGTQSFTLTCMGFVDDEAYLILKIKPDTNNLAITRNKSCGFISKPTLIYNADSLQVTASVPALKWVFCMSRGRNWDMVKYQITLVEPQVLPGKTRLLVSTDKILHSPNHFSTAFGKRLQCMTKGFIHI